MYMYATYTSQGLPHVHLACLKTSSKNHNVHATVGQATYL